MEPTPEDHSVDGRRRPCRRLFWVADILEDFVIHHPVPSAARIEAESAVNPRMRQAFLDFVPMAHDEALEDRLASLREEIEREFGVS